MSDLAGGEVGNARRQNGSSRAAGPVSQPYAGGERVQTPTDIMRKRRDREAKKKADLERREKELEEEERQRTQKEQTLNPDRKPGAAGIPPAVEGVSNRRSGARRSVGDSTSQGAGDRRSGERPGNGNSRSSIPSTTQPAVYAPSNGRTDKDYNPTQENLIDNSAVPQPRTRPRGATLSTGQPRPVGAKSSQGTRAVSASATANNPKEPLRDYKNASLNATTGGSQARQAPRAASQPVPEATPRPESRKANTSSFPHAFERWETLSSHWEGLTSFWIRRLEQNKEDLDGNPIIQQMARQVTDLSAAGANLFHAVVELQRLRASSERKFQRWFFETRAEQERFREKESKFDERIRNEQQQALEAQAALGRLQKEKNSAISDRGLASKQVDEMRRELDIAKKEARRAWEELGRREQEERDRTISLKQGQVTIVGGVQVVPMLQGASRQGSTANRPSTMEGPTGGIFPSQASHIDSPGEDDLGYTTYDPAKSETDTDPFTEAARAQAPSGHYREPDRSTTTTTSTVTMNPYQQTSNASAAAVQAARAATSSSPQQTIPQQARAVPASSASTSGTYLQYGPDGPSTTVTQPGSSSFYQHEGISLQGQPHATEADERSYVPSLEDTVSEEDYELNENGEVRRDAHGRPIPGSGRRLGSEDSDEYNVQEQLERERMYGRSYGSSGGMSGVEYGSGAAATAGAGQSAPAADYTGSGFGAGWEAMPRHHHPTRLSDVLEEDERSRTSPSRASQNSRGIR